uniref:Uncharacterized protein n=1 Tax=Ditylenchus dipsaci TaxID=166011 RepID=A0A915D166_9BILA
MQEMEVQTLGLVYMDSCTEPMEQSSRRTQTDTLRGRDTSSGDSKRVNIDQQVVDMIIQALAQIIEEEILFVGLDQLMKEEKVSLAPFKTVPIPMTDKLPIVNLVYGDNRRVAILLGEPRHDSWCTHTFGRLMLYQKGQFYSIYLQNCPTKAVFTQHNQLIVGTSSGQILLTQEGDILWTSPDNMLHSQAITCLHWLNPISLSDLPKSLRKNNVMAQKAGIVAVAGAGDELYVAGETGALWMVQSTENLDVQSVGYEKEGIEHMRFIGDTLIMQTPLGGLKKKTRGSLQPVLLDSQLKSNVPFVAYSSSLVIMAGQEGEG